MHLSIEKLLWVYEIKVAADYTAKLPVLSLMFLRLKACISCSIGLLTYAFRERTLLRIPFSLLRSSPMTGFRRE